MPRWARTTATSSLSWHGSVEDRTGVTGVIAAHGPGWIGQGGSVSSPTPPDRPPRRRPKGSARSRGSARPREGSGGRLGPEGTAPDAPGRPPGEGWDDGRGGRSGGDRPTRRRSAGGVGGGTRSSRGAGGRRGPTGEGAKSGLLAGLPRWALPAVGAFLVLVVLLFVLFGRGGGGTSTAGSCLTELSNNLPESSRLVYGTDLVQARSSGFVDDDALEELGDAQRETGAFPDGLTERYRSVELISTEALTARTGVEPGQIQCSLSDAQRSVMSGSFDVAEVSGSSVADDGQLAASEERLAFATGDADPEELLERRDGGGLGSNADVKRAIQSLRDDGSYSILIQVGNPDAEKRARVAGLGVADAEGDDRALVVAWAFANDDAAKAGRADIVDRVNGAIKGTSSITSDDLELDGSLVRATIETRKAPNLTRILDGRSNLIPTDN